ncbi:MFS transporter [Cysteiniphilum sp. 19S12-1]|uniref:MFS transporter n=1 Tax=Cysteiniphilum sp. 19S12-1 TaxID=3453130 RepID=UPI003F833B84
MFFKKIIPQIFLFVAVLFGSIQFMYQFSTGLITYELQIYFGINTASLGVLSSMFFIGLILAQIPIGILLDKFSAKKILIYSQLLLVFLTLCFILNSSFLVALGLRFFMGIFCAVPFNATLYSLNIKYKFSNSYLKAFSFFEATTLLITSFSVKFCSNIVSSNGWKTLFIIMAFLVIITMTISIFFWPTDTMKKNSAKFSIRNYKKIVLDSRIWVLGFFSGSMFNIVTVFCNLWGIEFLIKSKGYNYTSSADILSIIYLGLVFGCVLLGHIQFLSRSNKTILYGSLLQFILISLAFFNHLSFIVNLGVYFIIGSISSIYILGFSRVNAYVNSTNKGLAISLTNILNMYGSVLMQPFIGFIGVQLASQSCYSTSNSYIGIYLLPIMILISFIWMFLKGNHVLRE